MITENYYSLLKVYQSTKCVQFFHKLSFGVIEVKKHQAVQDISSFEYFKLPHFETVQAICPLKN